MRPGLPVAGRRHAPAVDGIGVAAEYFALVDDEEAGGECNACEDSGDWSFTALMRGGRHSLSALRSSFDSMRSNTS